MSYNARVSSIRVRTRKVYYNGLSMDTRDKLFEIKTEREWKTKIEVVWFMRVKNIPRIVWKTNAFAERTTTNHNNGAECRLVGPFIGTSH